MPNTSNILLNTPTSSEDETQFCCDYQKLKKRVSFDSHFVLNASSSGEDEEYTYRAHLKMKKLPYFSETDTTSNSEDEDIEPDSVFANGKLNSNDPLRRQSSIKKKTCEFCAYLKEMAERRAKGSGKMEMVLADDIATKLSFLTAFLHKETADAVAAMQKCDRLASLREAEEQDISYLKSLSIIGRRNYMQKLRGDLVDWLVNLCNGLNVQPESAYLAAAYIDRYAQRVTLYPSNLKFIGLAALFIAAKFEEIEPIIATELLLLSDDDEHYTKGELLQMERRMIKHLKLSSCGLTPLSFANGFHKAAASQPKVKAMSEYLIDLAIVEGGRYMGYLPSQIAAAAIAVARMNLDLSLWSVKLKEVTGYGIEQLRNPIIMLSRIQFKSFNTRGSAIYGKHCSLELMDVARVPPLRISGSTLDRAAHFPELFTTQDDSVPLRVLVTKVIATK